MHLITPRNAQVLSRLLDAAGGDPARVREVMHRHGRKQSDGSYSLDMEDAEALLKTSPNRT